MPIPKGRVVKTVGELRAYLDEVEATWTDKCVKFLGEFEHQNLWVPYFTKEGQFEGYHWPAIDAPAHAGGTFILDKPKED